MLKRKIIFSARQDHEVLSRLISCLKNIGEFETIFHDPQNEFFCLSEMPKSFKEADLIIVKVRNECSIDLLHYAKLNNIPTLHDVDSVLLCTNKIALDYNIRKAFEKNAKDLNMFSMPNSWNYSLRDVNRFKIWASPKLPIVIKSHYQHDKYNRFNFLVQKIEEVDKFCEMYKQFLLYDVYIQEFIACDGFERKIYVIGDKVFGVKRENPIYLYLREKQDKIDVNLLEREEFEITEDIRKLAKILSKELKLKIFGFDLVQPLNQDKLYLIDVNDFPSFKGIPNIEKTLSIFIKNYVLAL
ncbi:MAG: ATP-grasp domain-containing protein [Promethearchaeota archaeon]|jgi:glutathione synthase/RimK-type ligase-like ATP-grasp enzyme